VANRRNRHTVYRRLKEDERLAPLRDRRLEEALHALCERTGLTPVQQRFLMALAAVLVTQEPETSLPKAVQLAIRALGDPRVLKTKRAPHPAGTGETVRFDEERPLREWLVAWLNPHDPHYSKEFAAAYAAIARLPVDIARPFVFAALADKALSGSRRDRELFLKVTGDLDERPINYNQAVAGVVEVPPRDQGEEPDMEVLRRVTGADSPVETP